jgi:hypothetical protein
VPLHGTIDGALTQSGSRDGTTVTIDAAVAGGSPARLRVVLEGSALSSGGLALTSGTVQFGPPGEPGLYSGPVATLDGGEIVATLSSAGRASATATIRLGVDAANRVRGEIDVR